MPLEMILQFPFNAVEPGLDVGQIILTNPAHLPPDKEECWEDKDPKNVQECLK